MRIKGAELKKKKFLYSTHLINQHLENQFCNLLFYGGNLTVINLFHTIRMLTSCELDYCSLSAKCNASVLHNWESHS